MPTQAAPPPGSDDALEVVKWYTRARRFPQLIGKTPDGATIWGGPYTYTQVIAGVAFIVVGSKTTWLWGHFGLVGNALILLGCAYALVLVLGRLPLGSRNPLSVAAGAARALSSPAQGHLRGAPVRPPRPRVVKSRLVIIHDTPTLADIQQLQSEASSTMPPRRRHGRRFPRPRWSRRAPGQQPIPAPAARPRPTPASITRSAPTPALTGVQRLLASSVPPREQ